MYHISSGVSSKTKNHKAHLLEELVEVRTKIVHKDEKISRLAKRLQRLEEAKAWQKHQDVDEWSMHHFSKKRPQYQPQSKDSFNFVKLPSFHGSNDSSLYLDWKAKVEHIFHVYKVTEDQKVRLASLVFLDYAKHWWHHLVLDIGLKKRSPVVSWYDLKTCMCARFVPPSRKEHLLKFQRLPQGHRTVDEYFKAFETTLTKMNMHDNEESKIKWFVSGLRREIKDFVKLHECFSLKKVVHIAIKVESHLLKTTFKNTHDDGFYKSSRKDANNISTKILLPIFQTNPLLNQKFLPKILLPLNHPPKLQKQNVLNV